MEGYAGDKLAGSGDAGDTEQEAHGDEQGGGGEDEEDKQKRRRTVFVRGLPSDASA